MAYQSLVGKLAPLISLPNYTGETYKFIPGEKGTPAAIFFYPAAGSYGCTQQACQMQSAIADVFGPERVQIIGISTDTVERQKAFVEKEKLTYPVLSDVNKEAVTAYKVGSGMLGFAPIARMTFIVDKKGILRDALDATVIHAAHSKFVDKWLQKLEKEDEAAASVPQPTPTATAEEPSTIEKCARG